MKKLFIETIAFTRWVMDFLDDATYQSLQVQLMENPDCGAVIKGCGGLRKVRVALREGGRGRRGGARVLYLHVPELDRIFLVAAYKKGVQENLSADERRRWKNIADQIVNEARAAARSGRKDR
jgi:hypothetical protein